MFRNQLFARTRGQAASSIALGIVLGASTLPAGAEGQAQAAEQLERRNTFQVSRYQTANVFDAIAGPGVRQGAAANTSEFFAGNCRFLTRKLWGIANEPPFFHHGKFTTMREAILAHGGEAAARRARRPAISFELTRAPAAPASCRGAGTG